MAHICFTVLHYRTPFLYKLSSELEKRGHFVYWLCPSPKWFKWLINKGVDISRILDQTQAIRDKPLNSSDLSFVEEIVQMESVSSLTLNSMILMDRLLVGWNADSATKYLVRLYPLIKNFLIKNRIDLVVGEATPANELLTAGICEYIGTPYYFPITIRIPDSRFAFFKGRFHSECVQPTEAKQDAGNSKATLWAEQFVEDFIRRTPKPRYWYKNNVPPAVRLNWGRKFFKNLREDIIYRKSDPTRFPMAWLMKKRTAEVVNRYSMKGIKFHDPKDHYSKPFILYPLHKQPESSVDVLGDFYSDQLNLIKQIVRSLPATHKLFVKEHSNSVGDRPLWFYKEVSKLPNAILLSPYSDSYELLKRTSAILTISGTMAFEAGLLGVPAITFSKMFFNSLPSVRYCSEIRSLQNMLLESFAYSETENDRKEKVVFMAQLYQSSFEGMFTDCHAYPEVMDTSNICKVAHAIETVTDVKQDTQNVGKA